MSGQSISPDDQWALTLIDLENGMLVIDIFLAMVKPAEFHLMRLTQKVAEG
ncbi:hypothetical protein M3P05_08020 [Sansalvadorimonas sp. 2012CJ34-2]|uniref:Uncharacterized protein n=1 Tax=Parendozoicomonas callyspongiae TaxID=2942213 RepID=A0ABT0PES1_9GAMM|nr:hypothetical protein [Sansalvadorimonas sp. 2012CJ34-2]MCL6269882.1 hypothetical protein [Sansalvadorimonas sp. 2012CJ34-2]